VIETESVMNNQNIALTDEESGRINEVAGRLRLIQADTASGTPEQRREYLNEEIARSFKGVASAQRKRYLEGLRARFPVVGQIVTTSAPALAPAPTPAPAPAPETFEQLLERFLKAAKELPDPTRAEAVKRLGEADLACVDNDKVALEITDELRQGLGLPAGRQPRLRNLVQLCVLLVEAFQRLDQTALGTMKELAPRSSLLKRPQDFRNAAAQFLTQDEALLEPQVRMVASLVAALLAAMLGGGKDFGRQYVGRLSPSAIEDVVMGEGGGSLFGKNKKERCWDKYVRLAKDYETPDLVDRRIRDCLAKFVEEKVLGGR
jgi:hypothetical protein